MNPTSENKITTDIAAARAERATATIDLSAFIHNLRLAQQHCPSSKAIPVIKSDAYGHGMIPAAKAILASDLSTPLLAVATFAEALELHQCVEDSGRSAATRVLLLSGFQSLGQLKVLLDNNIEFILHTEQQVLELLEVVTQGHKFSQARLWLKQDTGMHRLGMSAAEYDAAVLKVKQVIESYSEDFATCTEVVVMSHLASADGEDAKSQLQTQSQITQFDSGFNRLKSSLENVGNIKKVTASFAASSGILSQAATHKDYIRPGIMLYGSSPFAHRSAAEIQLRPVMTLRSKIVAIKTVLAGEVIGYGGSHVCARDTRVGIVSIGYGDGYPRAASNGAPVAVRKKGSSNDADWIATQLIGRVSMDMITIDLSSVDDVEPGAEVELWGNRVSADAVAEHAATIAYELFCQVTSRVGRVYVD